jgi:hypothetical protein
MTSSASDASDQLLSDAKRPRGLGRTPMFGHRPVGWGRHAGAVFAAAFVSSTTQSVMSIATGLAAMRLTGGSAGMPPAAAVAITAIMLWVSLFVVVFAELAIGFTVARAALTLCRRNFGAAYVATGLVIGMIEASAIGALKGGAAPRDLVFAAAIGMLGGFVYWLVASRDRDVMAHEARAKTAAAFS